MYYRCIASSDGMRKFSFGSALVAHATTFDVRGEADVDGWRYGVRERGVRMGGCRYGVRKRAMRVNAGCKHGFRLQGANEGSRLRSARESSGCFACCVVAAAAIPTQFTK